MEGESVDDRLNKLQSRVTACRKRFSIDREQNTSAKRTHEKTKLKAELGELEDKAEKLLDEKEKEKQGGEERKEDKKQERENDEKQKADRLQKSVEKSEIIEVVDTETNCSKEKLHDFVAMFYPVLRDIPDWVSGSYLEFKDDRIRLCSKCGSLCEWIFFDVEGQSRQELCAHCFKDAGVEDDYKIYLRQGVTEYLSGLDAAAVKMVALSNSRK